MTNSNSSFNLRVKGRTHDTLLSIFAALPSIYILSFWVTPRDWDAANECDGSWIYAFAKFRQLNYSLGKDSWFTSGPISKWFGPPLGNEVYQPIMYYVIGIIITGLIFICFREIFKRSLLNVFLVGIMAFFFPLFFIGNEGMLELFFELAMLLIITTGYLYHSEKKWWIYCLMVLSAVGILYKMPVGILGTGCLMLAIMHSYLSRHISSKSAFSLGGMYLIIVYVLFCLTSGSLNLLRYLSLGLEVSSKYSEIMVANHFYSPYQYHLALGFITLCLAMTWLVSRNMNKKAAIAFFLSIMMACFLFFKNGHVRADGHITIFYGGLAPLFFVLTITFFSERFVGYSLMSRIRIYSVALPMLSIYLYMLGQFYQGPNFFVPFFKNWNSVGHRFIQGVYGQEKQKFASKVWDLKARHQLLFSYLNERSKLYRSSGKPPGITFYPYQLMFAEAIEGLTFRPSPSLQLYAAGPHTKIHAMEKEFLESPGRPDFIVIGPRTIGRRNPLSEYTTLLPALYNHYKVTAVIDGFAVLEALPVDSKTDSGIVCSDNALGIPGEFMQVRLDSLPMFSELSYRFATFLFKAPELTVTISLRSKSNQAGEYSFSGYVSQLQKGIFVTPDYAHHFFLKAFRRAENVFTSIPEEVLNFEIAGAEAKLTRNGGFWNLPVIPNALPLNISYCNFK